jgi:hypothetical protein
MESQKNTPPSARELDKLSDEERAAVVDAWRKNRADLSWKPLEGRELDRFLPFWNKVLGAFVAVVMVAGIIIMLAMISAPREVQEITATVIAAGKPDAEGLTTVIVYIEGEVPTRVTYRGSAQLRQGQEVVLEATVNPLMTWKSYRFKNPPESGS